MTFAFTLLAALSWDAEYDGFVHFRNWDGMLNDLRFTEDGGNPVNATSIKLPDGSPLSAGMMKDLCATDTKCGSVGCSATALRAYNANADYDLYLAYNSSVLAGTAMCHLENGGLYQPETSWICCDNDYVDNIAGTFALPPDLIHTSCLSNPACVAFRVKNDGTAGDLFKLNVHQPGCFQIPASRAK